MWHVLHTAPNCESQVCKFLAARGVESYAPQLAPAPGTKRGSIRDRRHRWVFPCYVFFKVLEGFSHWDVIRWAPGVRQLLHQDGGPAPLSDDVIDHIRGRLAVRSFGIVRPRFLPGQPVVIEHGPLAAVDAIFDRELDAPSRVWILVNLLGRPLKVEVDPAILRATA